MVSYKNQEKVSYPQEQWIVVKGTHDPIIDQETWDRVQALIAEKATPAQKEPEGMFARKVRCIYCGTRLRSVKNGKKRGFKCERHALSHDACVGAYISLKKLERIVAAQLQILSEELLDEQMLEEGIDPFADLRDQKAQIESTIANLKKAIEQNHAAMRSMYLDKVKGIISASEYSDHVLTLSEEKSDFERQIIEFNEHIEQIETTLAIHDNKKLLASQYTGTRILSKEMVSILIDYILVGRKDPLTKETPVEIHWNF